MSEVGHRTNCCVGLEKSVLPEKGRGDVQVEWLSVTSMILLKLIFSLCWCDLPPFSSSCLKGDLRELKFFTCRRKTLKISMGPEASP